MLNFRILLNASWGLYLFQLFRSNNFPSVIITIYNLQRVAVGTHHNFQYPLACRSWWRVGCQGNPAPWTQRLLLLTHPSVHYETRLKIDFSLLDLYMRLWYCKRIKNLFVIFDTSVFCYCHLIQKQIDINVSNMKCKLLIHIEIYSIKLKNFLTFMDHKSSGQLRFSPA